MKTTRYSRTQPTANRVKNTFKREPIEINSALDRVTKLSSHLPNGTRLLGKLNNPENSTLHVCQALSVLQVR